MDWNPNAGLVVELKDDTGTRFYNHVNAVPYRFSFRVDAQRLYTLIVTGSEGTQVNLTVYGLMKVELQ